jgi:hypothetical protein
VNFVEFTCYFPPNEMIHQQRRIMKSLQSVLRVLSVSSMLVVLSGCGSSAEEARATQVLAICNEANSALSVLTTDEIVPSYSADWSQIQNTYSGIKSKLQDLSSQASDLDESQLARDFSSISKNAGEIEAVASFTVLMGGSIAASDNVIRSSWLDAVNKLTNNEALRSPSDRTFIGCKSN